MKLVDGEIVLVDKNYKKLKASEKYKNELSSKIPLSKKIKPGYKKKRNEIINKESNKVKRERIDKYIKRVNKTKK